MAPCDGCSMTDVSRTAKPNLNRKLDAAHQRPKPLTSTSMRTAPSTRASRIVAVTPRGMPTSRFASPQPAVEIVLGEYIVFNHLISCVSFAAASIFSGFGGGMERASYVHISASASVKGGGAMIYHLHCQLGCRNCGNRGNWLLGR